MISNTDSNNKIPLTFRIVDSAMGVGKSQPVYVWVPDKRMRKLLLEFQKRAMGRRIKMICFENIDDYSVDKCCLP